MDSIDKDCSFLEDVGHRSQGRPEEAVKQIVDDLINKDAFNYRPGRQGYPSFPKFPLSLFNGLDYRELHKWITGLLKEWESLQTGQDIIGSGEAKARKIEEFFSLPSPPPPPPFFKLPGYAGHPLYYWP